MKASGTSRIWLLSLGAMMVCVAGRAQQVVTMKSKGIDVLIVANVSLRASAISSTELREVFTGVRSRLDDGTRVIPVALKGGAAHEIFLRNHLGEGPDDFRTRWRKAVFTGEGAMLKEFGSESDLLRYVAATPGAIGYVSRIDKSDSVKVVEVLP